MESGLVKILKLDALDPATLAGIVRGAVSGMLDDDLWAEAVAEEAEGRRLLARVSEKWESVTRRL